MKITDITGNNEMGQLKLSPQMAKKLLRMAELERKSIECIILESIKEKINTWFWPSERTK